MSGGGGAQGETRYNWNSDMQPRWNNLLELGMNTGFRPDGRFDADGNQGWEVRPREVYGGERYAPLAYDQTAAGSNIRSLNDMSLGTVSVGNNARREIDRTLTGGYLGEPSQGGSGNPYMGLATAGTNPWITGNQFMDQNTTTDRNAFAGDNPYFRDVMNQGMEDITSAYQRGTGQDLKRAAGMANAFGGSGYQQQLAQNEAGLGKNLGQFANTMLNQQYDRSAGLEDSFLNRDVQNQQFNRNTSAGLRENEMNRGFQNFNMGLDRGMQGYEGERNRQMQAIGQGQAEQGMALQRAGAQLDVGNMFQNQEQKSRDFNFDQWTQTMNHPYSVINQLAGLYGQAMGGGGMNQSVYGGGPSNAQLGIGAGLGLMSLFGGR
jgi:hypothetical protein